MNVALAKSKHDRWTDKVIPMRRSWKNTVFFKYWTFKPKKVVHCIRSMCDKIIAEFTNMTLSFRP